MTDAAGTTNWIQYDSRGRVQQMAGPAGQINYAYDLAGLLPIFRAPGHMIWTVLSGPLFRVPAVYLGRADLRVFWLLRFRGINNLRVLSVERSSTPTPGTNVSRPTISQHPNVTIATRL